MADGTLEWQDILNRMDDGRRFLPIVNRIRQQNEIVPHLRWMAANKKGYHTFLTRVNEPAGYWHARGAGLRSEHSETGIEVEPIGLLRGFSEIKDDYLRESAEPMTVKFQEDVAYMDGLSKTFTASLFYASLANDPRSFDGLSPRLGETSRFNVVSGGLTSGSTQSIWLIEHGDDGLYMVYNPDTTTAGITMRARPPQFVDHASDGGRVWTHFTEFEFGMGMCIKHHRHVFRYANLNATKGAVDLQTAGNTYGSGNTFSLSTFIDMLAERWTKRGGRAYITRPMWAQLNKAALKTPGVELRYVEDTMGREVPSIFGVMFYMVEQLGNETAVPA